MLEFILFYCFSAGLIISAIMMISIRNPVYAALFLILSFVFSAAIWLLLQAEFLGMTLILVYVGAVTVLILFVVMMLDIDIAAMQEGFAKYLPVAVVFTLILIAIIGTVINTGYLQLDIQTINDSDIATNNTAALGRVLYSEYLYPFEIAGALLLLAIVAAIALTAHTARSNKTQNPAEQVLAKAADRIRIVDLKQEEQRNDAKPEPE
jgi:NADH-quinone oxidoreductase subunit J